VCTGLPVQFVRRQGGRCGGAAAVLCGVRCARFHLIPHARTRHQSSLSFLLAKIPCCF
jgi:hypothetical protein